MPRIASAVRKVERSDDASWVHGGKNRPELGLGIIKEHAHTAPDPHEGNYALKEKLDRHCFPASRRAHNEEILNCLFNPKRNHAPPHVALFATHLFCCNSKSFHIGDEAPSSKENGRILKNLRRSRGAPVNNEGERKSDHVLDPPSAAERRIKVLSDVMPQEKLREVNRENHRDIHCKSGVGGKRKAACRIHFPLRSRPISQRITEWNRKKWEDRPWAN